jgi:DNA-binding transcriptional regulator YiaG
MTLTESQTAIRHFRQALQETQQQFATRLQCSLSTVARWETNRPPNAAGLVKLVQAAKTANKQDHADKFLVLLVRGRETCE